MRQYVHLHDERSWSRLYRRIVYRLIRGRYSKQPEFFKPYPPLAIHALGKEYQTLFPELFPWFLFFSKNMAAGLKAEFLRDCEIEDAPRIVHKRRVHRPPR